MRDDQRKYLLEEFGGFIERCKVDLQKDGTLSEGNLREIEQGTWVLEWLQGKGPPARSLLAYLEYRLRASDDDSAYDAALEVVFEHDAYVAAIADLR